MPEDKRLFLHFLIDPGLLKKVDAWRFKNQFASRAAAICWLLEYALKQGPKVVRNE